MPIPGFDTQATNNLRLWSSKAASGEFDFQKFNSGDYESSVGDQQRAETISAVLYPNDNLERGKELRLKQQYFWVAASLYDIVRRFKKSKRAWSEFPEQVAIQLNDTHPTLAVVELQRILLDQEGLAWDEAWGIVSKTVSFRGQVHRMNRTYTYTFSSVTPTTPFSLRLLRNGLSHYSRTSFLDTSK